MGRPPTYLIALALGVCATALAACGGGGAELLPGRTAGEITTNLETVRRLTDEGDCLGAESAARAVSEQIEGLEEIDPKLKRALGKGAAKLNEVISECEETTTEAAPPAEPPPETEEGPEKKEKEKEQKPKKEKPKQEEQEKEPAPTPGPPEETPPTVPPGQEGNPESPSGGVSPGSPVGEGD